MLSSREPGATMLIDDGMAEETVLKFKDVYSVEVLM
jgi:hypothetical protein